MASQSFHKSDWSNVDKAIEGLKGLIKTVPDFPKKGIMFKDIMPIFQVPDAVQAMVDMMAAHIEVHFPSVDVVVGLDARGFLIAPMVAVHLDKAFVPVRKAGKLPGKCLSQTSVKEYGQDVLEIQEGSINEGQNVVIIDDLLATGGTMATTCDLVTAAKGNVIGCLCLVGPKELNFRDKLTKPFHALIEF